MKTLEKISFLIDDCIEYIKNDNNTITWSQPDEKYQIYYNQKIEELFEKYGSVLGARWSQVF